MEQSASDEAMREFLDTLDGNHRLHLSLNAIPRLEIEYAPDFMDLKPATFSIEEDQPIPTGFWWGIDGSWAEWCLNESFRGGEQYFYKMEIDTSKIRMITTEKEFQEFEGEFLGSPWSDLASRLPPGSSLRLCHLNWPEVAKHYAGVEIAPYLYRFRLSSMWYYGWDCASGVVWDITAVKEFYPFAVYSPATGRFERQ